jgi:hypothetical protein
LMCVSMNNPRGVAATGQQIGAGWSPALSVIKALATVAEAKRRNLKPVYWLADEDHDRAEVASVTALDGNRIIRHRFRFSEPPSTAAGWLGWTDQHQEEAEKLWGQVPAPAEPSLRGHALALGKPLWNRGVQPFSPTKDADRNAIQPELERWRALRLENDLNEQAALLESRGEKLILDPRRQPAWFSLDPDTGRRNRLESGQPCPSCHWLSPGAALRPLMQSLLLPVEAVVLGPGEMAYWKLLERIWDRVGLEAPLILQRPSVFVLPEGDYDISVDDLEALRMGDWEALAHGTHMKPSAVPLPEADEGWGETISTRYRAELNHLRKRLKKLDARLAREKAEGRIGNDIEKLRQMLFPFGKPQERVLPGLYWLQDETLLDAIGKAMDRREKTYIVKAAPIPCLRR